MSVDKTSFLLSPSKPPVQEWLKTFYLANAKIFAATTTGTGQLTNYAESDIHIRVQSGDVSGTNPTLDIVIQESDTLGSGYATIATVPQITAADQIYAVKIRKTKRYIRFVATLGGTSTPKVNANILVLE